MKSFYWWDGKVNFDPEWRVSIVTSVPCMHSIFERGIDWGFTKNWRCDEPTSMGESSINDAWKANCLANLWKMEAWLSHLQCNKGRIATRCQVHPCLALRIPLKRLERPLRRSIVT